MSFQKLITIPLRVNRSLIAEMGIKVFQLSLYKLDWNELIIVRF